MARPFRCQYEGAIYHVTVRGNERRAIFRDDRDRRGLVDRLRALLDVHHVALYAYVLMPNHYHLVICTPRANLSRFMQQLNTSYTVYFNRRHRRWGHLFGGRFRSSGVSVSELLADEPVTAHSGVAMPVMLSHFLPGFCRSAARCRGSAET